MADRIRLTITVTPEVYALFSRMAEAASISLGKCMGDWLADTAEGAEFVALKMEEARRAPRVVMREMQAAVSGLATEVNATADSLRRPGGQPPGRRPAPAFPPSSNTGGKSPGSPARRGGKKS